MAVVGQSHLHSIFCVSEDVYFIELVLGCRVIVEPIVWVRVRMCIWVCLF